MNPNSSDAMYNSFRSFGEASSPAPGSQIPESQQSGMRQMITIDELLTQPGREHLVRLDPTRVNGTWFKYHKGITKSILKIFQGMLDDGYAKYSEVPPETRDLWFRSFAQEYTWDPNNTVIVRNAFDAQASKSYSTHIHEWKKSWQTGKTIPKGLSPSVWEKLKIYWQKETTIAQSATNSRNRRSDRGGLGMATHNSGAKTFEMRSEELAESRGGVPPDFLTLMEETHKNKTTLQIQDPKVRAVVNTVRDKYGDRLSQISDTGSSSTQDVRNEINQMVLHETPIRKGARSFLGTLPRSEEVHNAPYTEIPELMGQIQSLRGIIREKDTVIDELRSTVGGMQSQMNAFQFIIQQEFGNRYPQFSGAPDPPSSPPPPPQ